MVMQADTRGEESQVPESREGEDPALEGRPCGGGEAANSIHVLRKQQSPSC